MLSHNVFAYCANNPINRYDPSGKWFTLTMFADAVISAVVATVEVAVAVVSSPVVIAVAAVAAVGFLGYAGYRYYESTHSAAQSNSSGSSGGTKTKAKTKSQPVNKPSAQTAKFPAKPKDLDGILGVPGVKVPDGPLTPGRDKTKWKLPNGNVVTHEKHPYDVGAPAFHTDEHYHVDGPGYSHPRFSPGDPIPPIF